MNSRRLLLPLLALSGVSALLVTLVGGEDPREIRPWRPSLTVASEEARHQDEPPGQPRADTPTIQNSAAGSTGGSLIQPVDDRAHASLDDWVKSRYIDNETRDWQRFELVHLDLVALNVLVNAAPSARTSGDGSGPPPPPIGREADFGIKLFQFPEIRALVTSVSRYETHTRVAGLIEPVSPNRDWRFTIYFNPASGFVRFSIWSAEGRFFITATPEPNVAVVLWNPPPPPGAEDPPID